AELMRCAAPVPAHNEPLRELRPSEVRSLFSAESCSRARVRRRLWPVPVPEVLRLCGCRHCCTRMHTLKRRKTHRAPSVPQIDVRDYLVDGGLQYPAGVRVDRGAVEFAALAR